MRIKYKKVFIVFNPTAGLSIHDRAEETVTGFFADKAAQTDIFYLDKKYEENIKGYDFSDVDLVVAVGGDGTIKVAARTILEEKIKAPLAIIPFGSANVIAVTLGLPLSLKGALNVLVGDNKLKPMDVGVINKKYYFLVGFSVGYISKIVTSTSRGLKNRFGFLGYVLTLISNKIKIKKIKFKIDAAGQTFWVKGNSLIIFNALNYFGLKIKKPIEVDDGILNLFVLTNKTFISLIAAFFHLLWHQKPKRYVFYLDNERFKITFNKGEKSCQVDGDYLNLGQEVDVRVVPKAIEVITG